MDQIKELSIRELIVSSDQISSQTVVSKVYELFYNAPHLDALALVEDMKPVGLITRTKLFFTLSRRFGYELYARHPVITIADTNPQFADENDLLDEVIDRAFTRSQQDIYDEIVVTDSQGLYLGLLSVKQLVTQQSASLTQSIFMHEIAAARARELEEINQTKSHFIANVTHELRSPVNAIIGLTELLRMAAEKGSIEQIKERLPMLISSSINLRGVITNILDLSKMEAGKTTIDKELVDITAMLSEIAETTRILLGNKPVEVRVIIPREPIMIVTDPIKLRQVLTNLTSNAAKFTIQGTIDICLSTLDESVVIEVRDTGVGIREEDLNLIFTAFGQVEDATTKSHEGTGLGLTISMSLARLIGGSISVTSSYGNGSTFSLALPLGQTNIQGEHEYAA